MSFLSKITKVSWPLMIPLVLAILVVIGITRHYFTAEFPVTHDGENHLMRFANYKQAIKEGQYPPRIAPQSYYRTGYPVFNFNYPLANILSLPFSFVKIPYQTTFKAISVMSLLLGTVGCVLVLFKLIKDLPADAALFCSVLYAANPWILNLLYVRGTIGELMAYCLVPWVLLFSIQVLDQYFSALLFATTSCLWFAFLISHNISVLIFSPLLLLLLVSQRPLMLLSRKSTFYTRFLPALICGICLSLWFWLPALAEKQYTALEGVDLSKEFQDHFPTVIQLLWHPLHYGYSFAGETDTMSFALGLPLVFGALTSLAVMFTQRKNCLALHWALLACLAVLLLALSSFGALLWHLPFMHLLQFPWRLLGVLTLTCVLYSASLYQFWPRWAKLCFAAITLLHLMSMLQFGPVDTFVKDPQEYEISVESSSVADENKSNEFSYGDTFNLQQTPMILTGAAEISVQYWTTTTHTFTIQAQEPTLIAEPIMVFPGWITKSDTGLSWQYATYQRSKEIAGRIAYKVPAGTHVITTTFTQRTWPRILGMMISAGAATCLCLLLANQVRTTWKSST